MRKLINQLLAPIFIGVLVVSFNQNTAHIGGGYEANLLENNTDQLTDSEDEIIPYSEIPCDDLYKVWDIHNIHSYHFQRSKMKDTVSLVMGYEPCDFHIPREGYITSGYGKRDRGYHYGIDIQLRTGNEVRAAFEGMVRIAQYSSSYGNVVVIRHNNGLETLYAHLSKRKVKPGDYVQTGEIIGLGGNTGRSTGSHLHFETRYKGEPINPSKIIDFKTGKLKNDTIFLTKYNFSSSKNILKKKTTLKKSVVSKPKPPKKKKTTPKKVVATAPKKKPTPKKKTPPKKSISSKGKKYHKVLPGNTLYSLARENGVSVKQIQQWNHLKDNTIKVGSKIRVK